MVYEKIINIKKDVFSYREMALALGIKEPSARVTAARLAARGLIIRVKRGLYVIADRWPNISKINRFAIANIMQVPSYVSLMTALDYHGVTTLMQREFVESVAVKRTGTRSVKDTIFTFTKIDRSLYFGFGRREGAFVADPEKAFLDALYLASIRRYSFDTTSVDMDALNKGRLKEYAARFPKKTQKLLKDIYGRAKQA